MSAFDRDEQKIHDALFRITVDTSGLAGQVRNRLNEEIPRSAPRRVRRPWVAAAAIAAVLVVSAAAAAAGSFDWLIAKINPPFGEIVEPVEVSCEDQGIRMEVIGAQKYDNRAIVYLSLQDISGQNRLTEQTDFRDGFSVTMNPGTRETTGPGEEVTASYSWKKSLLFFDEETNTLYYEFNITADPDTPLSDPLELGTFLIYFSQKDYEEPVSLSLDGLDGAQVTPIGEDQIWGGMDVPDDLRGITVALTPGHYAALPHGDDQWISNIGMVNGKLHVQIGKSFGQEFGSSDATLALRTPDGKFIGPDYELTLCGDGNHRLLDARTGGYADAVYKYEESVFSVNTDELDDCTLYYSCSVYSGVEGHWKVAANLSDTSRQMRVWTNDVPVEGHLFEHMTLSPLGLQVIGSYAGEECMAGEMSLALETADGVIPLEGGGGEHDSKKQTFGLHWYTKTPLDVAEVTAVIINGTRIPVE